MPLDPEIRDYLDRMAALAPTPAWEQPLAETRRALREYSTTLARAEVGNVEDVTVPGPSSDLALRVYQPPMPAAGRGLVVFLHGGGFVFGDLDSHDPACRRLCAGAGVSVIGVDYRLAPEAPFPAAAEDAVCAARWALANATRLGADPAKVVLMGDSAGGNLAAVAALATRDAAPPPAGQVLVYPVTDMREVAGYASRLDYAEGFGLTQRAMEWFGECYTPAAWQREDPRASPIVADDLRGAPPALVLTAECDPLTSEGEAYAQRLAEAGVAVDYRCRAGAIHGALTNGEGWVAGEDLWREVFTWLAQRVGSADPDTALARGRA